MAETDHKTTQWASQLNYAEVFVVTMFQMSIVLKLSLIFNKREKDLIL